jgi:DNA-binding beta-propeller fold protein YncE
MTAVGKEARHAAAVEIVMPPAVSDALAGLGRTEDIRFSPDNTLLALAGYHADSCLVLSMRIERTNGAVRVHLDDALTLRSPALNEPHGFDFIGNDRVVVASRKAKIAIFRLPPRPFGGSVVQLDPETEITRTGLTRRLHSPGSIAVVPRGRAVDVYACNNYYRRITVHRILPGGVNLIPRGRIVASQGLDIPDGIAVSPDKRFLAVSNHLNHCVSVFDLAAATGPQAPIIGTLTGIDYPHGLRFSPDGRHLYVADAGQPVICRFDAPDQNWARNAAPSKAVDILSQQEFLAGRSNPMEGGPKGLELDATGRLIAVTNEVRPLAIYDLAALFA